jgi:hypothetical protein
MLLRCARSIVLAVKGCSNSILGYVRRHGKSPCFLGCKVSTIANVNYVGYVFRLLNIHDLL